MSETEDPLRFLDLRKKRKNNKTKSSSFKNVQNNSQTSNFVLPSFTSLNSIESTDKKTYNALKYFSQDIEVFLNKKLNQTDKIDKEMTFAKNKDMKVEMMTFSHNSRKKLFEVTNESQEENREEQLNQNLRQEQLRNQGYDQFEEYHEGQELKECEVCSRKFNPISYEKHVRVCERVFKQKRKPFRSRSSSIDHKKGK